MSNLQLFPDEIKARRAKREAIRPHVRLPCPFAVRLRRKLAELDAERERYSRALRQAGADPCAWPGCQATPTNRSKWCPQHGQQHKRELGKRRQAKYRLLHSNAGNALSTVG